MKDVLIETYWNVKLGAFRVWCQKVLRINRNILECKGIRGQFLEMLQIVLIETYWNVKEYSQEIVSAGKWVLIETYWNVKWIL